MTANKHEILATVGENVALNSSYWRLVLQFDSSSFSCQPGQFIMLQVSGENYPLLRRPFSIWNWRQEKNNQQLSLLYKVVGCGSRTLSAVSTGQQLSFIGPLGRSFKLAQNKQEVIIFSGGVGLAPLDFLMRQVLLSENNLQIDFFHGERNVEQHLPLLYQGQADCAVHRATDDGSGKFRGNVIDHFNCWLKDKEKEEKINWQNMQFFACGPQPMLKEVEKLAAQHKVIGEVSLERMMGCGFGVCLGCVTVNNKSQRENQHWARICSEGPVFSLGEVQI